MYFFKCQKFVLNGLKKKKFPEIKDFAALGAYIINYIRVLVPDDAYLTTAPSPFSSFPSSGCHFSPAPRVLQ